MIKLLFLLSLLCCSIITLSQEKYWQQEVNYRIQVKLNDVNHSLNAIEKVEYTNHSPDTLHFIWFHIWPNAYKNEQTAFSEQLLKNGRTDFYFSNDEQKGYINQIDFKVDSVTATIEPHPKYTDVVKLILPQPLLPKHTITITTPFHVQLPYNFSRGGHVGQSYQITQWYPKPAVYDSKGWHPIPYLDQGEFYSEFGQFEVGITVPDNYIVAATGRLQNFEEQEKLISIAKQKIEEQPNYLFYSSRIAKKQKKQKSDLLKIDQLSSTNWKTLTFVQNNIHDFAWFASKMFILQHDTIQLPSKTINAFTFFHPALKTQWQKSLQYVKNAVHFYTATMDTYPYETVSAVAGHSNMSSGGMEYPGITLITTESTDKEFDLTIAHEIGHNWLYGALASNERTHPWMDEGMNTYYEKRYKRKKYSFTSKNNSLSEGLDEMILEGQISIHQDQPIATSSEDFTRSNYALIAYTKASLWMKELEKLLGTSVFDSCMKTYYQQWKFKHPYPEDFKASIETVSKKNIDNHFKKLYTTGYLADAAISKAVRPALLFNINNTNRNQYISFAPTIGFNQYDKLMLGLLIHNYQLPLPKFRFGISPLYAINSKQINGIGHVAYNLFSDNSEINRITISVNAGKFSKRDGIDSNGAKVFEHYTKLAPAVKLHFKNKSLLSTTQKAIEFRSFLINEQNFTYHIKQSDQNYYPSPGKKQSRYINQLTYSNTNSRTIYPYSYEAQLQQGKGFYRASFLGNHYFNYVKNGGLQVRFFACKFGYLGEQTNQKRSESYIYQPKLTAVRGYEDYTYSNYFLGRTEFEGFPSQQIMERDGHLKIRTDLFQGLQGRSENWIVSVNLNTTIPPNLLPVPVPVKIFLDAGTYAEAWKEENEASRFLYVGGLQLSLFRNTINIYTPLIYSKVFRDNLKTVPEENGFIKKISFSINLAKLKPQTFIEF